MSFSRALNDVRLPKSIIKHCDDVAMISTSKLDSQAPCEFQVTLTHDVFDVAYIYCWKCILIII